MVIAILAITGFQAYWVRENYVRENENLRLNMEMLFRQTVLELQVSKMNLGAVSDSGAKVKMMVRKTRGDLSNEMVSTINLIRDKADTAGKKRRSVVLSMDHTMLRVNGDSTSLSGPGTGEGGETVYRFLRDIDSLQDSIRGEEIDSAYRQVLDKHGMGIDFSVRALPGQAAAGPSLMHRVRVGIKNPVVYELVPGNTFPYLLRRISLPILFSLVLLGLTFFSFLLLYRNLLRQNRLAEIKNEFISNITHELKTPIATVGVAIEALKNFQAMDEPARAKEYLDISSHELQRLGLLVDKVLKLSMFEKKEMEMQQAKVDLGGLVGEVLDSLRLQLDRLGATLSLEKEGELWVRGDRMHLQSVIFNLVDNAMKYSEGPPRIRILLHKENDKAVMEVIDEGIGIPVEYREKVFEKFFRVPHGDTHNARGYGLGLSYVAQVVHKHGGHIQISENRPRGVRVKLSIPALA